MKRFSTSVGQEMRTRAADRLQDVAYWLVIGLALLLPSADRRVNFLALLLASVVFLRAALLGREFFRHWDALDGCVAALLVATLASTAFGWPSDGYHGIFEALAHLTVFLAIRHGALDESQLRRIGAAVVVGVLVALAIASYRGTQTSVLQLGGVGGTIRSSLYTGIALMLCIGFALEARGGWRVVWMVAVVPMAAALLAMSSRAVIAASLVALVLGLLAAYRRRAAIAILLVIPLIGSAFWLVPHDFRNRLEYKATELLNLAVQSEVSKNDQARVEFWRVTLAWIGRGEHVLFGVGPRNFHKIDAERLDLPGPPHFGSMTRHPAHAHNLYLTQYVELGLVGLIALLALYALLARRLWRDGRAGRVGWTWWGALAGLLLPALNGLVGSPWRYEYAWLAILMFALHLARSGTFNAPRPS